MYTPALSLLQQLIATPSFSREEQATAALITAFLREQGIPYSQSGNNIWARNRHYHPSRPTILLNSHHDTVRPNPAYTRNPFAPDIVDGKLYGLGSNDAGAALVALLAAFLHFYHHPDLTHNLLFAASAEEEISGTQGIESILPMLGPIDLAIVGEPTSMQMAIAEKGLLVLDCTSTGIAGHAARDEGRNAIYAAIPDINWFRTYQFPGVSPSLGPIKMSVTMINAGTQHNVVPASCQFTVDIRCTDAYTHEELLAIIRQHVSATVTPRSMRLKPSSIPDNHPIVLAGKALGLSTYGSPTSSDQALMPFTSLKIGPGDSARSHSADEFVFLHELDSGIDTYIQLLNSVLLPPSNRKS
jgi:acetylornithine deacetylase